MSLAETILAVSIALSGPTASAERLAPVAAAIANASEAAPLWEGDDGPKRTALLLLSIGWHESHLRPEVLSCKVRGDANSSLGAFQLHTRAAWGGYSQEQVCGDEALQARLALRLLRKQRDRGVGDERALLRAFAAGDAGKETKAGRELAATLTNVTRRAHALP